MQGVTRHLHLPRTVPMTRRAILPHVRQTATPRPRTSQAAFLIRINDLPRKCARRAGHLRRVGAFRGATSRPILQPTPTPVRRGPPAPAGGYRQPRSTGMDTALSALDLARLQFAFTVSFHIVFPALSIGLASFIAVLEYRWLKTGKQYYKTLCLFWSKIFAVAFGMGVVSGVVMSYQFGTNWSGFELRRRRHRAAADVRGHDRVLPRGRLPRHHAVRLEPRERARTSARR